MINKGMCVCARVCVCVCVCARVCACAHARACAIELVNTVLYLAYQLPLTHVLYIHRRTHSHSPWILITASDVTIALFMVCLHTYTPLCSSVALLMVSVCADYNKR